MGLQLEEVGVGRRQQFLQQRHLEALQGLDSNRSAPKRDDYLIKQHHTREAMDWQKRRDPEGEQIGKQRVFDQLLLL